jgi:hypothetical protein
MTESSSKPSHWGKSVVSMLVGGIFGFLAIMVLIELYGNPLKSLGGDAFALACVGLVYGLIGVFVLLGTLFPEVGAKVLNVSGREDLEDQRAMMLGSSLSYLALGLALFLLALAGPGGPVSATLALGGLGGALLLLVGIYLTQWHLYDELWRQLSWECAGMAFSIALPVITLWGALAHLGMVANFSPLGVIAALTAIMLIGAFAAIGRRGMLTQG